MTSTPFGRGRYEFETAPHELSGVGSEGQTLSLRGPYERLGAVDRLDFGEEHRPLPGRGAGEYDVTLPADRAAAADVPGDAIPGNRERVERFFRAARHRGTMPDATVPTLFVRSRRLRALRDAAAAPSHPCVSHTATASSDI
ncbi:hypothetical protein [Streptomyces griseoruber]|uniref:Uncharacterized protein n=1 Tax=Streptomyces griseoruber TaxID=1943 RepID=A0A101T7R5_9ACTN|nr:hypothetical protein [Streptomyces griseoruber]KUN87250.1 hypothetical protein AQJ64_08260 [Streptomyces griseoruber]